MRLGLMVATNSTPQNPHDIYRSKDYKGGLFLTTEGRIVFEVPGDICEPSKFFDMSGKEIKLEEDERIYTASFAGGSTGITPEFNERKVKHLKDADSHKAFGVISITRGNHYPKKMFGSKIRHYNSIEFCVQRATREKRRDGSYYFHGRERICEFSLTPAQFGDLISSFGVMPGIPCVLEYTMEDGIIPYPDDDKDELNEYTGFHDRFKEDVEMINNASKDLKELFESKKTMKKDDKARILSILDRVATDIGSNADTYIESYKEMLESTKFDFAAEIEAEARSRVMKYGIEAIQFNALPLVGEDTPTFVGENASTLVGDKEGEKNEY